VNAKYIVDALGKFLKVFKQKRLEMVAGDWWFPMRLFTPPPW
jgi:hypothetical protein